MPQPDPDHMETHPGMECHVRDPAWKPSLIPGFSGMPIPVLTSTRVVPAIKHANSMSSLYPLRFELHARLVTLSSQTQEYACSVYVYLPRNLYLKHYKQACATCQLLLSELSGMNCLFLQQRLRKLLHYQMATSRKRPKMRKCRQCRRAMFFM